MEHGAQPSTKIICNGSDNIVARRLHEAWAALKKAILESNVILFKWSVLNPHAVVLQNDRGLNLPAGCVQCVVGQPMVQCNFVGKQPF